MSRGHGPHRKILCGISGAGLDKVTAASSAAIFCVVFAAGLPLALNLAERIAGDVVVISPTPPAPSTPPYRLPVAPPPRPAPAVPADREPPRVWPQPQQARPRTSRPPVSSPPVQTVPPTLEPTTAVPQEPPSPPSVEPPPTMYGGSSFAADEPQPWRW